MANSFNWREWLANAENQKTLMQGAGLALAAAGAAQANKYQEKQDALSRGDSLLDKQRAAYLGRANDLNNQSQQALNDEFAYARAAADISDPYAYKDALYRDATRSQVQSQIGKMLGMQMSPLLSGLNNSVAQRNAMAMYNNELNAQDVNPNRSARDLSSLMGMSGSNPLMAGLQSSLNNYVGQSNARYDQTRHGMVNNTNTAYDKVDTSIANQLADPKIDPATGEKKKTSTWRKVLGGVVKYGVPIALMATGVGAPAGAAMLATGASSSLIGDKIAGKGWKEAALGAGLAAIPGGSVGSNLTKGIANKTLQMAANQGLRAASDYIPGVGTALSVQQGLSNLGKKPRPNSSMYAALMGY